MKRKHIVTLALAGLLSSTGASAADADGNYAIWGVGSKSCHQFNVARKNDDFAEHQAYVMGYLTDYNSRVPDTYNISGSRNIHDVLEWLDGHCRNSPMESFESALRAMTAAMSEDRSRRAPR